MHRSQRKLHQHVYTISHACNLDPLAYLALYINICLEIPLFSLLLLPCLQYGAANSEIRYTQFEYTCSGGGRSLIGVAHIHIFVFTDCKNNRFQKKLMTQNTNI